MSASSEQICSQMVRRFGEYVDCELAHREASSLAQHLADCDICREELRLYRRTVELARDAYRVSLIERCPDDFVEHMMRRLYKADCLSGGHDQARNRDNGSASKGMHHD